MDTGNRNSNPDEKNIVIQNVTSKEIRVLVDGRELSIPNNLIELRKLTDKTQHTTLQAGEKIINIGEIDQAEFKTIINAYNQESKRSFYLRLFLLVFVPILGLALAYLLYRYQTLRQPLSLTVRIKNMTPSPELGEPKGYLILNFGDKSERQPISETETTFKGIPPAFRKENVQLSFSADGFYSKDSSFMLGSSIMVLPVARNSDFEKIAGTVHDEKGEPIPNVRISVLDLSVFTDISGRFSISIPFHKQRPTQRLETYKNGYLVKNIETPVIPNEMVRLILQSK